MGRNRQRSRGQQAFEQLLMGDSDAIAQPRSSITTRSRKNDRGTFIIHSPRETSCMHQLVQIFPTHEQHVLQMVLESCDNDLQRTIDAVLHMESNSVPHTPISGPGHNNHHAGTSTAAAAAAHPSPTAEHIPHQPTTNGPCMWDALPNECKQLIFAHLNLRDFARMAATSSEFAETARQLRSHIRQIRPPPEASWESLHGMVAAHRNAQLVGLSRWAGRCKYPDDYERLFVAVANGSRAR